MLAGNVLLHSHKLMQKEFLKNIDYFGKYWKNKFLISKSHLKLIGSHEISGNRQDYYLLKGP